MQRQSGIGSCWVHIFEKPIFGGRGELLHDGQTTNLQKARSIIVGPAAIAKIVSADGREVISLPPLKLVTNLSNIRKRRRNARICVAKA
jgi:hypothetical protein